MGISFMLMAASRLRSKRSDQTRLVLMGVAGCGKSSVGAALSQALSVTYCDGDDLHPPENIAKMSQGQALTDQDHWLWLACVRQALVQGPLIIGCSALKRSYRDFIRKQAQAIIVYLSGSRAVIDERMRAR